MRLGSRPVRLTQGGQGMTEYLIVLALIAISSIVVFSRFGQTMRNQVAGLAHELVGTDANRYGVFLGCFLVGSSRVDLQACKLEYSIVSPK